MKNEPLVMAGMLMAFLGGGLAANAQSASGARPESSGIAGESGTIVDPNLPLAGGDFSFPPSGPELINRVIFFYDDPGQPDRPTVKLQFATALRTMTYLGFNGEGSWLVISAKVYTLKGKTVRPMSIGIAQVPKGLSNPSETYVAETHSAPGNRQGASGAAEAGNAVDPNLPLSGGDFSFPSSPPEMINRVRFYYDDPGQPDRPFVQVQFGTNLHAMTYLGFNGEGSWLADNDKVYTLKGRTVKNMNLKIAQAPRGLANPSETYLSETHSSLGYGHGTAASSPSSPVSPTRNSSETQRAGSAAAVFGRGGTDARIERLRGAATLTYKDGEGKAHTYKVMRPQMGVSAEAAKQFDSIDTGGWLYIADDGKSGILFNVTGDRSVTATPLPAQALGMLAGRK